MIQKLDIASTLRLGLAVLLFAAALGSACLTMFPAPAIAGEMIDHGGSPQHESDCCATGSIQAIECCSQATATVSVADPVSTSMLAQQLVVASPDCCGAGPPIRLAGPPPASQPLTAPLRL